MIKQNRSVFKASPEIRGTIFKTAGQWFTREEVVKILKKLKAGKVPELDGLATEFQR